MNCPCGKGTLTIKTRRNDGKEFYACSNFPTCKRTWEKGTEGPIGWADQETTLLRAQVEESIKAAVRLGYVRGSVGAFLCKVLGLRAKDNQHFIWKLNADQCRKVLVSLGEA